MSKIWKVKEGATKHLIELGYLHNDNNIDGLIGIQCGDYREQNIEYPHVGLDFINTDLPEIGVSIDWLIPVSKEAENNDVEKYLSMREAAPDMYDALENVIYLVDTGTIRIRDSDREEFIKSLKSWHLVLDKADGKGE